MCIQKYLYQTTILTFVLGLGACTVGPNFHKDHMQIPEQWTEKVWKRPATAQEIAQAANDMRRWWEQFHDPLLNQLVEKAIANNYDLKIAGQRILAAQSLRDQQSSNWYPQLDGSAGYGYQTTSYTLSNTMHQNGNANNTVVRRYGATFSWQLDAFGRIRRMVQSQEEAVKASIEDRRSVLLTMLSQLANNYVTLRNMQLRLRIADENVAIAQYVYNLTQKQYQEGTGTTLSTAQAQAELEAQRASREPLKTSITQITHAIDVLLGQAPGTTEALLKEEKPLPDLPPYPPSIPSIALANRPDVRMAEHQYAEATANIGIAVSELYPQFTIDMSAMPTTSFTSQMANIASLVSSSFINMSIPGLHGGRLSAQVKQAQAQAEASRLQYRQTILNALKEIEDVIAAWGDDAEHVELLHRSKLSSQLALSRAQKLYKAGLTGYLDVLTAQRTATNAANAEAIAILERFQDAVNLFTALGAGWQGVDLTKTELPVTLEQQNIWAKAIKQ
ncbi:efflux transporter outer membrane subunit [Commensalibacter oyaizuii]|uniref:Efflux transporter outer membrane subunit n=1 Tax=Commensalibacter oyaizuii TaxID=3043873 RepID=A0ABT6Q1V1_9PROT|nr:efflux transporter outer membrane subunit [Commensalibacter sp. TBRC 16381]MDI2091077.1 efflux transporter outer membrane subunit [Commensalibacter sp. TBRC 16381]